MDWALIRKAMDDAGVNSSERDYILAGARDARFQAAMSAQAALIVIDNDLGRYGVIARHAVKHADALIEELSKPKETTPA